MSLYASLDFVQLGLACARDDRAGDPTLLAYRRRGDVAYVAMVSSRDGSLSASFTSALNRMLDGVGRRGFEASLALLRQTIAEGSAEPLAFCLLRIDDRARMVRLAARDVAVWVRSGPVIAPLASGESPYRAGDAFLLVDPAADALLRGERGAALPAIGRSNRAPTIARDLLDALIATAPRGTGGLESVVAVRVVARDGIVTRKRIVAAVAISAAIHFLITGAFGLFHPPLTARERERHEPSTIVTISSAPRKAAKAVQRPPAPQRVASRAAPQQPAVQPARPAPQIQRPIPEPRAASPVIPPVMQHVPEAHIALNPVKGPPTHPSHSTSQLISRYSPAQMAAIQSRLAAASRELEHADPLAVPSSEPAAPKRYAMDMSGGPGTLTRGQGILRPLQSWQHDGYTYYYVSYEIVFSDGTSESGNVPWPIRYLPAEDPFTKPPHTIPLPAPLPDYVLPAGTHLGRALKPYFRDAAAAN